MTAPLEKKLPGGKRRQAINRRLRDLDEEWDLEAALEMAVSAVTVIGGILSLRKKSWMILPFGAAALLMRQALMRHAPLEFLKPFGLRSFGQVQAERYFLKMIRGDFQKWMTGRREKARG
jgi:hypothetical protein